MNTYATSGVDIEKGNELAKYLGFKDFGATIKIGGEQVVMSTDGVGTKVLVAEYYDKFDTIGIDLVAMCVNDILCKFAEPKAFLDYYATGKLDLEKSKQILNGILKVHIIIGSTSTPRVIVVSARAPRIIIVHFCSNSYIC